MTPYYQDAFCTIYHGDCNDVLPRLEPESVDLIVTGPPYGIRYRSNWRRQLFEELAHDDAVPVEWVHQLARLSKFRTAVYWFATDESIEETRLALQGAGFGLNTMLVWDKQATTHGNLQDYASRTEFIVFGTKGPVRLNGNRDPNLLSVPRVNPAVMVHPTEKPIPLLSYLVLRSSDPNDLVLDPFMGSGTTLAAAKALGRRAIGIEVDESYCEVAARRLGQEALAL